MINNDSILNQLNNYKRLNNAGVGITMRSYPTYVERYYPIEAEDNIKILKVYKLMDDSDPIELEFKKTQEFRWNYDEQTQQFTGYEINPLEGFLILFDEGDFGGDWKAGLKFEYSVNNGESIEFPHIQFICSNALIPSGNGYLSSIANNINDVTISISEQSPSIIYGEGNGFVPTSSIIYTNNNYVGTHTNFAINYDVGSVHCSTSFNIFSVYFPNQ